MARTIVVKEVVTETAHRLSDYDGACFNVHGHSYRWQVGVSGGIDKKTGMVIDFKFLKELMQQFIVDVFDHKLILHEKDKALFQSFQTASGVGVVFWYVLPTAENFVSCVAENLRFSLPENLHLEFVRCWETEKSYAEWRNE